MPKVKTPRKPTGKPRRTGRPPSAPTDRLAGETASVAGAPQTHDTLPEPSLNPSDLEQPGEVKLSDKLADNERTVQELLGHAADLIRRSFVIGEGRGPRCTVYFYSGLSDKALINASIITPLMVWSRPGFYAGPVTPTVEEIRQLLLAAVDIDPVDTIDGLMHELFGGHAILLIDGIAEALIVRAKGYPVRSVGEPTNEASIRGPHEGFVEDLTINLSLLRRKLKTPHLAVEEYTLGNESPSRVCLVYLRHIAPPQIVQEVRRRLTSIEPPAILTGLEIENLIRDHPYSLWPTAERSGRPDTIARQLLNGRVTIFMDHIPAAITMPQTVWDFFQAPDDWVESFYISSLLRMVRIWAFLLATFGTAAYVALVTFHPSMIPLPLMLSITATQVGVPLPIGVLALIMEVLVEVVREAGIRLPTPIGSAVTVLSTIVIGQAATAGGFVPPGLVVVVSSAAIASFAVPSYAATLSFRIMRFPALLAANLLGLYGVVLVFVLVLFDVSSMKSLGVPFSALYTPGRVPGLLEKVLMMPLRAYPNQRQMWYRDRYERSQPPAVRWRIPWLEKGPRRK